MTPTTPRRPTHRRARRCLRRRSPAAWPRRRRLRRRRATSRRRRRRATDDGARDHRGADDDARRRRRPPRRRRPRTRRRRPPSRRPPRTEAVDPADAAHRAAARVRPGRRRTARRWSSRSTTTRAARPQSGLNAGRHRVRGDRRGRHPLRRRVPLAGRQPGRPDPLRPHPGRRPARRAATSRCSPGAAATPGVDRGDRRLRLHRPQPTARHGGLLPAPGQQRPRRTTSTPTPTRCAPQTTPEAGRPVPLFSLPRARRGAARATRRRRAEVQHGQRHRASGSTTRRPAATCARTNGRPHDDGNDGQRVNATNVVDPRRRRTGRATSTAAARRRSPIGGGRRRAQRRHGAAPARGCATRRTDALRPVRRRRHGRSSCSPAAPGSSSPIVVDHDASDRLSQLSARSPEPAANQPGRGARSLALTS